jgi:hypothetical protein
MLAREMPNASATESVKARDPLAPQADFLGKEDRPCVRKGRPTPRKDLCSVRRFSALTRATSQAPRQNVLDVNADAVPAQGGRCVDRRDGQFEEAPDREIADRERRLSAWGPPSSNSAMWQQSSIVAASGGRVMSSPVC